MKAEKTAEICHEVNRAYCESIGDTSQVPWKDCPDWQKNSAIDGVENIIANPGSPPSASHENWLKHKHSEGWKYGPAKDAGKKEHPCMVAYDDLPDEQKTKDYLFHAVVLATITEISR